MTTEDRLDDQGLKSAEEQEEKLEVSSEEQEIDGLESQLQELSDGQADDSKETGKNSEQSAGESEPEGEASDDEGSEDELPENVDDKVKQAFIKQRQKNKELKRQLEEAKNRQVEEAPEQREEVEKSAREVVENTSEPKADAKTVMDLYLRALNKDLTPEELSKAGSEARVIQLAETALAKHLSSKDLYDLIQDAIESGDPNKDDIIDIGNKYLSIARYREEVEAKRSQSQNEQAVKAYEQELASVKNSYPDFLSEETPLAQFGKEWDKRMIGVVDQDGNHKAGELDKELAIYLLQHPMQHAKMILDAFNLSAKSGEQAKEAIKKLSKEKAVLGSGESGSPPLQTGENRIRTPDDIERELELMSSGT